MQDSKRGRPAEPVRGGLSATQQALDAQAALLPYALAVFSVLPLLSHSFEVLGYNIGRGYNYLALPIVAAFLVLLLYLTFGLRPGKGDDGRPSRPL